MTSDSAEQLARVTKTRWPSYQPMVLVVVAFCLGIFLDRQFSFGWQVSCAAAWVSLASWFLLRILATRNESKNGSVSRARLTSTLLLIGIMFAGSFWHHGRWNWFGVNEISRFAAEESIPCCVDVTATSEPHWMLVDDDAKKRSFGDKTRTKLAVRVDRIRAGEKWLDASGKADLVIHASTKHVKSGDQVRVFGRLVKTSPPFLK